mmetsp:Transcript_12384/g.22379  ORF Transcript_12384/g.22379 Transcript_12384/m.22379 type:complete len:290 (+) Transcript_12384:44-913(+)
MMYSFVLTRGVILKSGRDRVILNPKAIKTVRNTRDCRCCLLNSSSSCFSTSVHVINATNGIELLPILDSKLSSTFSCYSYSLQFSRIQSTLCEQGHFDKLLCELDHSVLLPLSLGIPVYVYDIASRNKQRAVPRSIWYGIEFIKYALTYYWNGENQLPSEVYLRGINVVSYWNEHVLPYQISKSTKKKLRYYKVYHETMDSSEISLYGVYGGIAQNDGDYGWYANELKHWMLKKQQLMNERKNEMDLCENKVWSCHEWMQVLDQIGLFVYDSSMSCQELIEKNQNQELL